MKIYKESGDRSLRVAGRIDFDVGVQNSRLVETYLSPAKHSCLRPAGTCDCSSHRHYVQQQCHCSCHGTRFPTKTAAELFAGNRNYLTNQILYEPKAFEREERQERSHRGYFIPTGFKINPSETQANHFSRNYQFCASKAFKSVDEELLNLQNRKQSSSYHSREYAPPHKPGGEFSTKSTEAPTGMFGSKFSIQPKEETSFGQFKNRVLSTSYSKSTTSKAPREPGAYSEAFKSPAYRDMQDKASHPSPETRRLMMNKLIEEMEARLAKEKAEEERNLREKAELEEFLELKKRAKASALESEVKAREKSSQRKQREAEVRAAAAALERERLSKLRSSREKGSNGLHPDDSSQRRQDSRVDRDRFERIEAEIERLKRKNLGTSSSLRSKEKGALLNSLEIDRTSAALQNEEVTSRKERQTPDKEKLKQLQSSLTKKHLEEEQGKDKPRKLSSKLNQEDSKTGLQSTLERDVKHNKSTPGSPRRPERRESQHRRHRRE